MKTAQNEDKTRDSGRDFLYSRIIEYQRGMGAIFCGSLKASAYRQPIGTDLTKERSLVIESIQLPAGSAHGKLNIHVLVPRPLVTLGNFFDSQTDRRSSITSMDTPEYFQPIFADPVGADRSIFSESDS